MARFIVNGGKRLSGRHKPPGNKNAALPMLAACVMTDQPVRLRNVPLIDDVQTMLSILDDLGASVEQKGHTVTVCAAGLRKRTLAAGLCQRVRSSILFAGPMVARYGRVSLVPPGGDVIGRRRLDTHFDGLAELGVRVQGQQKYMLSQRVLRGARILLDEASVTATENVIMAATLAQGVTTVFNAACEPHVQDLCRFLNKMGAHITGIGTNYLRVEGVKALHGTSHRISADYIDIASFAVAGLVTGGEVIIDDVGADDLQVVSRCFEKVGARWIHEGRTLRIPSGQRLRIRNDHGAAIPKIEDGPWPAFPSDLMSVAIVLATQTSGTVLFFEKMFESRMYFVDRLIEMGARIVQCDPHRVIISGGSRLHGTNMSSPDIRAGIALVLAASCAKGVSTIGNAQVIDRGYEHVEVALRKLGGDIVRID